MSIHIPSDDSPSPPPLKKRLLDVLSSSAAATHNVFIIDDDPTPQKPTKNATPSFVAETPLSPIRPFNYIPDVPSMPTIVPETPLSPIRVLDSEVSVVKCTLAGTSLGSCSSEKARGSLSPNQVLDSEVSIVKCTLSQPNLAPCSSQKARGIAGLICLESDDEAEGDGSGRIRVEEFGSSSGANEISVHSNEEDLGCRKIGSREDSGISGRISDCSGSPDYGFDCGFVQDKNFQARSSRDYVDCMFDQEDVSIVDKGKVVIVDAMQENSKTSAGVRKKQLRGEKARLQEEQKQKKQEEKLQKQALKVKAAEERKLEKERQKWEKGKFAVKSIVVEIDSKVIESGAIGGHLLTRLAEKGLSFRIITNPIKRSIIWKMDMPDQISELSTMSPEVPYILLVYQAEEFCDLVSSEALDETIKQVRQLYPTFTLCYLTNRLMSYLKKCEQSQYRNPSNMSAQNHPPVDEALSRLVTHYSKVHSRQCIDEAEVAEHVAGLTCNLASCQFRKKLTWLSVHANGSFVPKDFIDKNLIKKNVWLKALTAIRKVQPRYAVAIWKKYPTMRSLLNVYMDRNKSVHEKEFLLKDLMVEGLLGKEDRRLGEVCSKRVYRILMAQSGHIKTDDIEEGADFFNN